jgi:ATP-dependent exoDNAse (exonuclease V) beta subunit
VTRAPVDADARQLVVERGLDATLFVEAGAGTGKTTALVGRIVQLVTRRDVELHEIAAITFTEAAAAELRDRVRRELEVATADSDRDIAGRARRALEQVDAAALSTLHSFAQRILSEHPIDVGIPPQVEVLDEVQSRLAFEDRWDAAIDRWMQDPSLTELLTRTTLAGIEINSRTRASLRDAAVVFNQNWDRLVDRPLGDPQPPGPIDLGPLQAALRHVLALPHQCGADDDALLQHLLGLTDLHRALHDSTDPHHVLRLLTSERRSRGWASNRGQKGNWTDVGVARATLAAADAAADALRDEVVADVLAQWRRLLASFTIAGADQRRAAGRLEFHDLLVLARHLLRHAPDARRQLRRRYTHLLLDEFQDTDPIQIELAVLLASAHTGAVDRPWHELPVDDGRLFFVGDPKQSIYRFRRADIGLFLDARDRFATAGAVQLVQNFRTVPTVLAWVNHLFSELMAEERPRAQPKYAPLAAARADRPGTDHRVVLLGGPHEDNPDATALRRREAADVAACIATIRAEPAAWSIERDGTWIEPSLSDITILVPSRLSLPMLQEALVAADIPYRIETSSLIFDSSEVRDLLTALQAVDDPGDAIAVVAACRGPLFGCADTDLFDFHQAGGSWDYRVRAPGVASDHPVAAALAVLDDWHRARVWSEPSALLVRIVRERDVFAAALSERRPRDAWRRIRFLVDQARRFVEAGGGDLPAFLRWSELQRHEGARVPEPSLPESDDDAVRVMTFHGAKGLEFPITILSGLTTQPGNGRRGVKVHWDDDGVPQVRLDRNAATDNFEARNEFEEEMDADEKLRLLYVGATRAMDHLIVSAHHKSAARPTHAALVWHHSEPVLGTSCRSFRPSPVATTLPFPSRRPRPPADAVALRDAWQARRAALLAAASRPHVWSATAIAAAARGGDDIAGVDGADGDDGVIAPVRPGRAGTAFGRAVHAVLEVVPADDPGALEHLARLQAEHEGLADAAADIAAAARAALASPAVRAAREASRVWRELFVTAPVGDTVLEGFIDLLVETPDGLHVIDYKTDLVDRASADDAVRRYRLQAATYALALEISTDRPVTRCTFVFVAPDRCIERDVDDVAAAVAEVRAFLASVSSVS